MSEGGSECREMGLLRARELYRVRYEWKQEGKREQPPAYPSIHQLQFCARTSPRHHAATPPRHPSKIPLRASPDIVPRQVLLLDHTPLIAAVAARKAIEVGLKGRGGVPTCTFACSRAMHASVLKLSSRRSLRLHCFPVTVPVPVPVPAQPKPSATTRGSLESHGPAYHTS